MDRIVEGMKRIEDLFLENAEMLLEEEVEPEDLAAYRELQGAGEEALRAFETRFQLALPEEFKALYRYKNGSGPLPLIWPWEDHYEGYRLLSLEEMIRVKTYFQNQDREMADFPECIGPEQLRELDGRIKPHLLCRRWFPFAEYAGSLYLMLDYDPAEQGAVGQIICYVHDPDFVYYVAADVTEMLKLTEAVIEEFAE